jgi:hypothetical protein
MKFSNGLVGQRFSMLKTSEYNLSKSCYVRYTRNEILNTATLFPAAFFFLQLILFDRHNTFVQSAIKMCNKPVDICDAITKTKLRWLSPRANYTDRATAACRRS